MVVLIFYVSLYKLITMRKYENGYWDKINYWANTLKEAVDRKDIDMVKKAAEKLNYFHKRQEEVYG